MGQHLLQRGVAAAVLGRLARQQPARVEQRPLPAARPLGDVRAGPRPFAGLRGGRQVLVEERRELGPELLDLGVAAEPHNAAASISSSAFRCAVAEPSSRFAATARLRYTCSSFSQVKPIAPKSWVPLR